MVIQNVVSMSNLVLLILSYVGTVILGVAIWAVFRYSKNYAVKTFVGGGLICVACIVFFSSFNTIQNMVDDKKVESKQEVIIDLITSQPDSVLIDSIKWN